MHFALTMIQFSVVHLATNFHNPVVGVSLMKSQPIVLIGCQKRNFHKSSVEIDETGKTIIYFSSCNPL